MKEEFSVWAWLGSPLHTLARIVLPADDAIFSSVNILCAAIPSKLCDTAKTEMGTDAELGRWVLTPWKSNDQGAMSILSTFMQA